MSPFHTLAGKRPRHYLPVLTHTGLAKAAPGSQLEAGTGKTTGEKEQNGHIFEASE